LWKPISVLYFINNTELDGTNYYSFGDYRKKTVVVEDQNSRDKQNEYRFPKTFLSSANPN